LNHFEANMNQASLLKILNESYEDFYKARKQALDRRFITDAIQFSRALTAIANAISAAESPHLTSQDIIEISKKLLTNNVLIVDLHAK